MVRDSAPLKGDCNEKDRWRRHEDDDDLERKDQARVTGEVLGGMTNLDVEDEEHQMEEQPWRSDDWRTPTTTRSESLM